jgi:putative transposase
VAALSAWFHQSPRTATYTIPSRRYQPTTTPSFNGLYKWELIYPHGSWEGLEDVEFATLEYVDWFNHRRRHGEILDGRRRFTTPAAHQADYYRQTTPAQPAVTQ